MSEPGTPRIRASDAERERVADVVRRAVGDGRLTLVEGDERLATTYAAVHRADLVGVTADLEAPAEPPHRPTAPDLVKRPAADVTTPGIRTPTVPDALPPAATTSVAVFGRADRQGEWTPGRVHRAMALMGGVGLDLRHARLDGTGLRLELVAHMGGVVVDLRGAALGAGGVDITAVAVMGGVVVVVDEDTEVEEHGVGILGGFEDSSGRPHTPGGPRVRIRGVAIMGGVEVQRRDPWVRIEQ